MSKQSTAIQRNDYENNIFRLELQREFKNIAGYYKCQLLIKDTLTGENVFSQTRFKYRINKQSCKSGT